MSNCIQLKTSVIKGIKNQLLDQFPDIEAWLNHIMPKKDPVKIVRWYDAFYTSAVFFVVDLSHVVNFNGFRLCFHQP